MLAENQPAELANLLTSGRKSDVVQVLETMKPLEVAWVCLRMSGYLHSQDIRMLTQYLETRVAVGKKK